MVTFGQAGCSKRNLNRVNLTEGRYVSDLGPTDAAPLPHGTRRRRRPAPAPVQQPGQVVVYSGPEPPSGGVRRPPLAVMAPHWTQFDAATSTVTRPSSPAGPAV